MASASDISLENLMVGVELGGTKTIMVLGHEGTILSRVSVPTTTSGDTLGAVVAQLAAWRERYCPVALGIGSFGPIGLDPASIDYGRILPTPKPGWTGVDVLTPLAAALEVPTAIHTDVTIAALAEAQGGGGAGMTDLVYVTLGTGIGMGVIANGHPVIGRMHPEAGHLRVRRLPGDAFAGSCPFHGDCLEGLASGPAVAKRCGIPGEMVAADDPAWIAVADAIAESFAMLLLTTSPEAILVGGGLGLGQQQLLPLVRRGTLDKLAGYLPNVTAKNIGSIIRYAELGIDAGPLGSLILAAQALERSRLQG